jgi:deazaflavin-dependent oxidoreductase (nitroreductase family)
MSAALALVGAGLILAVAACWVLFVVAMRSKCRPVIDAVRRVNRSLANREELRTAGQPGAWASVVHHVGRTTGTPYRTPVVAAATTDGFVIGLPYGTRADWVRNVLAAGSAVVESDGDTYRVDRPEVVAAVAADPYFPPKEQRKHRLYGVDDFLLLRHAHPDGGFPADSVADRRRTGA